MSKSAPPEIEAMLEAAGVDVAAAKAGIATLDEAFGGEAGLIPDGALSHWVNEHFDSVKTRAFFILYGHAIEAKLEKPKDREWETGPDAAEIKAKKNLEKLKK